MRAQNHPHVNAVVFFTNFIILIWWTPHMSYCRKEGKDKIIFVTESDHAEPSKVPLPDFEDEAEYEGLIKANGEINWECPCLGGMAAGVCGEQFKNAFSCFHVSQSEPKGSECIDQFRTMQECFNKYPDVYGEFESVDEDEKDDKELFNGESDKEMDGEIEQQINDEIGSLDEKEVQQSSQDEKEVEQSSQDEKVVQESKTRTVEVL